MLKVSKERILEKLNSYTREALKSASEAAIEQSHFEVTVSHYLLALIAQPGGDWGKILSALGVSADRLEAKVKKSLQQARRGAQDLPEFATLLIELLQDALMLTNAELGEEYIRSGAVFAAIAQNPDRYCHFYVFAEFEGLDAKAFLAGFTELTRGSMEGTVDAGVATKGAQPASETALEKFGRNITAEARDGRIDPVFCRDMEIAQMTDVLCRRRKNNPILVGDPGSGKRPWRRGWQSRSSRVMCRRPCRGRPCGNWIWGHCRRVLPSKANSNGG